MEHSLPQLVVAATSFSNGNIVITRERVVNVGGHTSSVCAYRSRVS